MIKVNPVPSLRQVGVRAYLDGVLLRVPKVPASVWLEAIFQSGLMGVLELCEDSDALEDAIAEGEIKGGRLEKVLSDMLAAASGRVAKVALLLTAVAAEQWPRVGGELIRLGLRPDQMPYGAFLDAVYAVITRNMKPEELEKFDATLMGSDAPNARGARRPAPSPVPASAVQYVATRSKTRIRQPQNPLSALTEPPTPLPSPPVGSAPEATTAPQRVVGWPAFETESRPRPIVTRPRVR